MTNTQKYKLKKPSQEDFYNVDDFNDNADIIEAGLTGLSAGLGAAAQESTLQTVKADVAGVKATVATRADKATLDSVNAKADSINAKTDNVNATLNSVNAKADSVNGKIGNTGDTVDSTLFGRMGGIKAIAKSRFYISSDAQKKRIYCSAVKFPAPDYISNTSSVKTFSKIASIIFNKDGYVRLKIRLIISQGVASEFVDYCVLGAISGGVGSINISNPLFSSFYQKPVGTSATYNDERTYAAELARFRIEAGRTTGVYDAPVEVAVKAGMPIEFIISTQHYRSIGISTVNSYIEYLDICYDEVTE